MCEKKYQIKRQAKIRFGWNVFNIAPLSPRPQTFRRLHLILSFRHKYLILINLMPYLWKLFDTSITPLILKKYIRLRISQKEKEYGSIVL